ncbi:MAG TPA: tocopherol cyclase family protein [Solirubrobacteraceae bacterium]|nr:tocopherol cyclase family protein [Solirubrobacteraceae bacterium]
MSGLHDAYRRTGADLPFGDPRRAHGVAMEGYYWRLSDPGSGRCIVALCGVCRAADGGSWAVVALAAHPGGFVRWRNAPAAAAEPDALGATAWEDDGTPVLRGSERRIAVDLGPDARLEATLEGRAAWPLRLSAVGLAQAVPGLPQYWHPAVLGARVRGEAMLGGERVVLDGWDAYVEKNWGGSFPGEWWWGQAALGDGAMAAFAGGRLGGPLAAGAVVVRAGGAVVRFAPPGALVTASAGGGEWRLRGRSPLWTVSLEGDAASAPHILPVPVPAERRAVMRSEHHLAGRMRVVLRRGRRVVLRASSGVAGLEHGTPG